MSVECHVCSIATVGPQGGGLSPVEPLTDCKLLNLYLLISSCSHGRRDIALNVGLRESRSIK